MRGVAVGWHHITCGCGPEQEYGIAVCPLHLHAPKLLQGCQVALKYVTQSEDRRFLKTVIAHAEGRFLLYG